MKCNWLISMQDHRNGTNYQNERYLELGVVVDVDGVRGVLLDEGEHGLLSAVTLVRDGGLASGDEVEGGETLDVEVAGGVVGRGIHHGDAERLDALGGLGELLVDGGKALAVAAPGGVELDHDVLVALVDELLKGGADDRREALLRVLGRGLGGLDRAGKRAVEVLGDELRQGGARDLVLLGESEVLTVVAVDGEDRVSLAAVAVALDHLRVAGAVEEDEAHLALELTGDAIDDGLDGVVVLRLREVEEEPSEGDAALDVAAVVVGADLVKKAERLALDEGGEVRGGRDVAVVLDLQVVELLVQDNVADGLAVEGADDGGERVLVAEGVGLLLELEVDIVVLGVREEDEGDVVLELELLESLLRRQNLDGGREATLDKGDDGVGRAAALVVGGLAVAEHLDGGVAADVVLGGELLLHRGVDLDEVGLALEGRGGLLPLGGQLLAVAAPGGVELDHDVLVALVDELLKGGADDRREALLRVLGRGLGGLDRAGKRAVEVLGDELRQGGARDLVLLGESEVLTVVAVDGEDRVSLAAVAVALDHLRVAGAVEEDEAHLALELTGDAIDDGLDGVVVLRLREVEEEPSEGDAALDVAAVVVGADLVKKAERLALDEGGEVRGGRDVAVVLDLQVVELLVQDNVADGLAVEGADDGGERVLVAEGVGLLLELEVDIVVLGVREEDEGDVVLELELLESLLRRQ
eukprot:PhM_4_TR4271/c1_g1_i1/m.67866